MDKYKNAILEYDAARLEIIELGKEISKSTEIRDQVGNYLGTKCTLSDDKQCFEFLWEWNIKKEIYSRWEKNHHWEDDEPDAPDGEEPPVLCECCKITQSLVDARKAAKQRFGIAKRRISAMARTLLAEGGVA